MSDLVTDHRFTVRRQDGIGPHPDTLPCAYPTPHGWCGRRLSEHALTVTPAQYPPQCYEAPAAPPQGLPPILPGMQTAPPRDDVDHHVDKSLADFEQELTRLINRHSIENICGTPDYILASHLTRTLQVFAATTALREGWYGRRQDEIRHAAATRRGWG